VKIATRSTYSFKFAKEFLSNAATSSLVKKSPKLAAESKKTPAGQEQTTAASNTPVSSSLEDVALTVTNANTCISYQLKELCYLIPQRTALRETSSRTIEMIWVVWEVSQGRTEHSILGESERPVMELRLRRS
jgi:hypothetical protein